MYAQAKKDLEAFVLSAADTEQIPCCVKDTSDLIKLYPSGEILEGFTSEASWFRFNVSCDDYRDVATGGKVKRLYGSLEFSIFTPSGQGGTGGAEITDFLHSKLQGQYVGSIRLRGVRNIGEFELADWSVVRFTLPFEQTATN